MPSAQDREIATAMRRLRETAPALYDAMLGLLRQLAAGRSGNKLH